MSRAIEQLQADHRAFTRLIEHMESAMERCLQGDDIDLMLMSEFVDYCSAHADDFHHPLEDRVFDRLLARDPGLGPIIRQLEQEHLHLRWATRELRDMLEAVNSVDYVRRDRFLEALGEYLGLFHHHISTEEERLFRRADRLLTEEDVRQLDAWLDSAPVTAFARRDGNDFQRLDPLLHAVEPTTTR